MKGWKALSFTVLLNFCKSVTEACARGVVELGLLAVLRTSVRSTQTRQKGHARQMIETAPELLPTSYRSLQPPPPPVVHSRKQIRTACRKPDMQVHAATDTGTQSLRRLQPDGSCR